MSEDSARKSPTTSFSLAPSALRSPISTCRSRTPVTSALVTVSAEPTAAITAIIVMSPPMRPRIFPSVSATRRMGRVSAPGSARSIS